MAISIRGSATTWTTSTSTTLTRSLPTHAAGDMLIVRAIRKPYTNPTDMVCNTTGWAVVGTQYNNGTTAVGGGTGSMAVATFWKIAESSSETSPVITWGTTAAPGAACAIAYQKGASETWETPTGVGGVDSTAASTVNDTLGTHISVTSGDMVDFWMGWCDDSGTPSAASMSQPGVTYTVTSDIPATALDTSTSNDLAADGGYALATAGTSTGAATITANFGASEQHIVWMTRLRVSSTTTVPGSFTANAVVKAAQSSSFTANAVIKKTIDTPTFSADATRREVQEDSFAADATVLKTLDGSVTADASVLAFMPSSFTADSFVGYYFTADAIIQGCESILGWWVLGDNPFGACDYIYPHFTLDAMLSLRIEDDFFADAVIERAQSGSLSANAVIEKAESGSLAAGAVIERAQTGSFTADATIERTQTGSLTSDAVIESSATDSFSANAIIERAQSGSLSADAVIEAQRSESTTADAVIVRSATGSFTAFALIESVVTDSFTADADIFATVSGSFTAGAWLSGTFTADATIRATTETFFIASSWVEGIGVGAFSAYAIRKTTEIGDFTADAIRSISGSGSLTADAVISSTISGSLFADAVVSETALGSLTADAAFLWQASGSFSANAVIDLVSRCIWTTPADGVQMSATPTLAFLMPQAASGNMHFQIEIDTDSGYPSPTVWTSTDPTGWEYWDGADWQPVPQAGVSNTYCGNEARYTVQSPLSNGTYYRRVRAGVI